MSSIGSKPQMPNLLRKQQGLSLVELMVALVISMFLMAGFAQILVSNRKTYDYQQAQSAMQENSRFSMYYLQQVINKAGYRALPQDKRELVYQATGTSTGCSAFAKDGQVVTSVSSGTGVCIRYEAADPSSFASEVDCSGNALTSANAFITRIYFDSTTKSLMCAAQGNAATTLVTGIENMQFDYGVDSDGDRSANKFVSSPASDEWDKIVSIRVSILTTGEGKVSDGHQTYRFPLNAASTTTATDYRTYRSSQTTVTLKNIVL